MGNYRQYPVTNHNGKEYAKEYIYICIHTHTHTHIYMYTHTGYGLPR